MARTFVYVDGFNLFYGAVKGTPYKWLDIGKLCQIMLPKDNVRAIKYFTAQVSGRPTDPDKAIRQQVYWRALRTNPEISIILGHFLTHSVRMTVTGKTPPQRVWVDKTEEKGSDVNLASHLLHDAFKGHFDVAVLITNDSDLALPVRMVREVCKLPVGILNPHQNHSVELKRLATFIKRIRQSDVISAQFPDVMTDHKGSFPKPGDW